MNYKEINRQSWNKQTEVHFNSEFYDNESFIQGRNSLNSIELDLLGDVKGESILHLQCHFGQDTISLNRMGAHSVGVDISDRAIERAKQLAATCNSDAEFVVSDVYDLPEILNEKFDLVFTTYGTIGWLPDLNKWAEVIANFLKPEGKLVFVEFHPVVWMFDTHFERVEYRYFQDEPIVETCGTYTDGGDESQTETVSWNHGLAEVYNSLQSAGLRVEQFQEYDYSPYSCFKGAMERKPGEWIIEKWANKLPLVYSMVASKN